MLRVEHDDHRYDDSCQGSRDSSEASIPKYKFKASADWVENDKHHASVGKGIWNGRPLPGSYTDDDSEDDGLYLHELIEQRVRERAMKEADTEVVAQNAKETDTRIPTVDLESSTATLSPSGEWTPSVQLTLGENNSTALYCERSQPDHLPSFGRESFSTATGNHAMPLDDR